MTERTNATNHETRWSLLAVLAPALLAACGASAAPSAAVATTAARATTDDDTGYGYEFEVDPLKNAGASPASALSLPHAPGDRVPPETIQAIARAHYGALAGCYEVGLKKDPALTGTVTVKLVVGEDGVTKSAADDKSTLPDKGVVDCIVGELGKLAYPRGGGVLTVVYPVQLAP